MAWLGARAGFWPQNNFFNHLVMPSECAQDWSLEDPGRSVSSLVGYLEQATSLIQALNFPAELVGLL